MNSKSWLFLPLPPPPPVAFPVAGLLHLFYWGKGDGCRYIGGCLSLVFSYVCIESCPTFPAFGSVFSLIFCRGFGLGQKVKVYPERSCYCLFCWVLLSLSLLLLLLVLLLLLLLPGATPAAAIIGGIAPIVVVLPFDLGFARVYKIYNHFFPFPRLLLSHPRTPTPIFLAGRPRIKGKRLPRRRGGS